jgi:hypothetical protein
MTVADANPFPSTDPDRREIWEMLVARDTDAYLAQDWSMVAGDFVADSFHGIDARRRASPDAWRMAFPSLATYREEWLRQAAATASKVDRQAARAALLSAVTLQDIEIAGDYAIAHKKFDGRLPNLDGAFERLHWRTVYICRRHQGRWKIASFVGYLPNDARADGDAA